MQERKYIYKFCKGLIVYGLAGFIFFCPCLSTGTAMAEQEELTETQVIQEQRTCNYHFPGNFKETDSTTYFIATGFSSPIALSSFSTESKRYLRYCRLTYYD